MDPLSQGALGAAVAAAWARPEQVRLAAVLGGLSGMAPDLDVLVRSPVDPLLFLEVHRQFSHALAFIPIGAFICAVLAFPLARARAPFGDVYAFCLTGYATHGLLDACTSYGTQLLWPLSDLRVAWNVVSVVDPLFTLPLVGLGVAAALRRTPRRAQLALAWAAAYLLVGVAQRERAESFAIDLASTRGHAPLSLQAKPAFGNLLLWKTIYETEHAYHVDALRLGPRPRSFPGQSAPKLDTARDLAWLEPDSQQARDLDRFRWFSSGFVALDPARADRVIDVRYSMLPNRIEALWGIHLDAEAPTGRHARYFTSREATPQVRTELMRLLFD